MLVYTPKLDLMFALVWQSLPLDELWYLKMVIGGVVTDKGSRAIQE